MIGAAAHDVQCCSCNTSTSGNSPTAQLVQQKLGSLRACPTYQQLVRRSHGRSMARGALQIVPAHTYVVLCAPLDPPFVYTLARFIQALGRRQLTGKDARTLGNGHIITAISMCADCALAVYRCSKPGLCHSGRTGMKWDSVTKTPLPILASWR